MWDTSQMFISVIIVVIAIGLKVMVNVILKSTEKKFKFTRARKITFLRVVNLSLVLISTIVLIGVWEIDPEDLFLYLASIFTVVGIAFFHQRSHLSNITAGLMLFFNHRVKVGDFVTVHDGDDTVEGNVEDIGLLFITLVKLNKDMTMISNTLFVQKTISINQIKLSDKTENEKLQKSLIVKPN